MTDAFRQRLDEHFSAAVPHAEFARWTADLLAPHGFTPDNTLPMVGLCRDELTEHFEGSLTAVWGHAFDLSSLGGMLLLGRTGLRAALHHAPGSDGRQRFAAFVFSHIGIDGEGVVGSCDRVGQVQRSHACGALIAFRDELVAGKVDVDLDPRDLEQSLLRQRLLRSMRYGHVPDLVQLTKIARNVIVEDLADLGNELLATSDAADVAVFSGVLVHGPGGQDWVAPSRCSIVVRGEVHRLDSSEIHPAGSVR